MGIHYPPGARARFTKALGQLQEQGELWDFAGLLNIEIGDGDYTDHELRQRIVNFVYAESFSQEGQADGRRQLVANESSESLAGSTPAPSAAFPTDEMTLRQLIVACDMNPDTGRTHLMDFLDMGTVEKSKDLTGYGSFGGEDDIPIYTVEFEEGKAPFSPGHVISDLAKELLRLKHGAIE